MSGTNVNIMLIVVAVAVLFKVVDGYKKGVVKEVVSLISLVVLCIVAALAAYGVNSYHDGKGFNVAVIVILLIVLITAHRLVSLALFPAKLAVKLPIVSFLDKLLGVLFGVFEVVLLLWTLYAFLMIMDVGNIRQTILDFTRESALLTWIYDHNYLARGISACLDKVRFLPLLEGVMNDLNGLQ